MKLHEYILHPFHAIKKVWGYNREPEVRRRLDPEQTGRGARRRRDRERDTLANFFAGLYEENRIHLYAMYREIDQDPLVAGVQDVYAEVASQANTDSAREEAGRVVWVRSRNQDVQRILVDLFDRIQIDDCASTIIRAINQNGDQFEGVPAVRNQGISRLDPYDPWEVGIVKDALGRVSGYGEVDSSGEVVNADSIMPFNQMIHFRMPYRYRTDWYGVRSSLLYNVRDYWQELQWVMDKVMIERLQRKPPRMAINLDVTGMSTEEGFEACKRYEEYLYRDIYFNPDTGILRSLPAAWGEQRDMVFPTGGESGTSLTQLAGSGQTPKLDDLDFFLRRVFAALRFPPGYFNLDLGTSYVRNNSIQQQDVAFSQHAMRGQSAFLRGLIWACRFHLAYHQIDPYHEDNRFLLMMSPVSTFAEIERNELTSMRFELMEKLLSFGDTYKWNSELWYRFVMMEYGHIPERFVNALMKDEEQAGNIQDGRVVNPQTLTERIQRNHKRAAEALAYFHGGGSMVASNNSDIGSLFEGQDIVSVVNEGDTYQGPRFQNPEFDSVYRDKVLARAKYRANLMQQHGVI